MGTRLIQRDGRKIRSKQMFCHLVQIVDSRDALFSLIVKFKHPMKLRGFLKETLKVTNAKLSPLRVGQLLRGGKVKVVIPQHNAFFNDVLVEVFTLL